MSLSEMEQQSEAFYAGLRLVAMGGSHLEVDDESGNIQAFGYSGRPTGHAGYLQAQCAILVECDSHAILAANLGAYRSSE